MGARGQAANFLTILGTAHSAMGNHERAIELHLESRLVAQSIPDPRLDMNALGNLANLFARRGSQRNDMSDLAFSIKLQKEVLQTARDLGDDDAQAASLMNVGQVSVEVDGAHAALPYLEKALLKARTCANREIEIQSLFSLGALYRTLYAEVRSVEALDLAMAHLEAGIALTQGRGDIRSVLTGLINVANVHYDAGGHHYRDAVGVNEVIVSVARKGADPDLLGTALRNLSLAYAKADLLVEAIATAEEALPVLDALSEVRARLLREDIQEWRTNLARRATTAQSWFSDLAAGASREPSL